MRAAGLSIAADARAMLLSLLGGDRLASRNEIRKLALYAQGQGRRRARRRDGGGGGRFRARARRRAQLRIRRADRRHRSRVRQGARWRLLALPRSFRPRIRHVANLHKMKLAADAGGSIEAAMKRGAPPVHFTREKLVGEALRAWTPARLLRAIAAARRRIARRPPQRTAGRSDCATDVVIDRGQCAAQKIVIPNAAGHRPRKAGRSPVELQIQLIAMRHPAIARRRIPT